MSNPQIPFTAKYVNSDVGPQIPNETNKHITIDKDIHGTHRGELISARDRDRSQGGVMSSDDVWVWQEA